MALVDNRKAFFNYDILEKFEAGLELLGTEVKSLKGGHGSLAGSYVTIRGGEAWLVGAMIPPHQAGNVAADYNPTRPRKLLLTKKEIGQLAAAGDQGLTAVPLSVYNKKGKIKAVVAIACGKKKYDKRQSIKKREAKRQIDREMKNR